MGSSQSQEDACSVAALGSAKKLLVLDINGLLVHRIFNADPSKLLCAPDAVAGEFTLFLRPHVRDFIQWCSARFVIVIWSTVQAKNISPLVDLVFGDLLPPATILDQSHCIETGLRHCKKNKPLLVKLLDTVWKHPSVCDFGAFDSSNTLLLDDSPYKAAWNAPHTAAHPREWTPHASQTRLSEALAEGGEVRQLLDSFVAADDGRSAVEAWIATQSKDLWASPLEDDHWDMVTRSNVLNCSESDLQANNSI